MNRISEDVGLMEGEMERDRIAILELKNRAMNETLRKCKSETEDRIRDVKLQRLEYQMDAISAQVRHPSR